MVRTVTVLGMQKNLGRLLEQVDAKGDQYVVEQAGRPIAAMVPVWQLKEWRARRDRFFAKIDAVRRRRPLATSRAIGRDVAEAIERTRRTSRRRPA
jgi:antitoxin (DNA-binding transcriptional repressor) of toxin-antitoxin stability system